MNNFEKSNRITLMASPPFLEDIFPKNLLFAVIIRSPAAKGILKNIEVPALPDHFFLITAKDIPGKNKLYETDMPILAEKNLSYIGEPVAVLLGYDKTKLEDIMTRCIVTVEEETPVFSCGSSNEPSLIKKINIGDAVEAFKAEGKVVTGSYKTGIQDHWYAEPAGASSWWYIPADNAPDDDKKLIVRLATQWPYHAKHSVSIFLGLDVSSVTIEPTALNLHMDGKLWYSSYLACLSALGTYITDKPVRLILNKDEDFFFTPKRFSSNINIASLIDEKGTINTSIIDISVNLGAFKVNGKEILDQICFGSLGFYKFNNLMMTAKTYQTNIPPQGPFSGFGLAQGLFAIERHISQIADILNIDPAELRKMNSDPRLIHPSKTVTSGEELLDTVTKMSDYYRKWSSCELLRKFRKEKNSEKGEHPRGIGIAMGFQGNGLLNYGEDKGNYTVEATLTKDGILEIKTSISSPENFHKIWQKTAAEIISIQPDMVSVISDGAPDSGPSCASRNITAITKLVEKCCVAISKQRFHDPLPITVRRSVKPQSGSLRYDNWKVMDTNGFIKPGLAAAVVEVSIDLFDCAPRIRGIWLAVDGGKIISNHRAKRNLTRAVTQALGWTFTEDIEYENGILPENQYNNFATFSLLDTPPIQIEFLSTDVNEPKGIGELPFSCVPAAFMQAVSQAMDHCFKSIPLKRNEIWEILRERNDVSIQVAAK